MTPGYLAALHARCFVTPRPWSAQEFADFLATPGVYHCAAGPGFALGRVILDEAELLTLAVDPAHRRRGLARIALAAFEDEAARRGAARAFLEVAADNTAARAFYAGAGWAECGLRRGYYRDPQGRATDAVIYEKPLKTGI